MIFYDIRNMYLEHYDYNALITILNSYDLKYFGILHDKDKFPNGNYKKSHYHLIIGVEKDNKIAKSFVYSIFNDDTLIIRNVRSLSNYMRYLTHKDNLEKYQYNDNDVFTNDLDMYSELIEKQITISKSDLLLDDFYNFLINKYDWSYYSCDSDLDFILWFKNRHKLDYYLRNKRSIDTLIVNIYKLTKVYKERKGK